MKKKFIIAAAIPLVLAVLFTTLALCKVLDEKIGVGLAFIFLGCINLCFGLWMIDNGKKNNSYLYFVSAGLFALVGLGFMLL